GGFARQSRPFASPARAQLWFEWRMHGLSLPIVVACTFLLIGVLILYYQHDHDVPKNLLALLVLMPVQFAFFLGIMMGETSQRIYRTGVMPPFLATRPVASASLVAAKLKMAALSALATWAA